MELIQNYISTLQLTMDQLPQQMIADVIDVLQQTRRKGSQVFILGNGGSASTAPRPVVRGWVREATGRCRLPRRD